MVWKIKTIVEYLEEQGIIGLVESCDEEDIINKLREEYQNDKITDKTLRNKLIVLENEKIKLDRYNFNTEFGILIAIFIGYISMLMAVANSGLQIKINTILYTTIGLFALIIIVALNTHFKDKNKNNVKIAINIHKSIIEEKLKEMNKEEKSNHKTKEDLKELQNSLLKVISKIETLLELSGK